MKVSDILQNGTVSNEGIKYLEGFEETINEYKNEIKRLKEINNSIDDAFGVIYDTKVEAYDYRYSSLYNKVSHQVEYLTKKEFTDKLYSLQKHNIETIETEINELNSKIEVFNSTPWYKRILKKISK